MKNEKGYVLIITLLLLVLISGIAFTSMKLTIAELQIATNDAIHRQVFYAADSGLRTAPEWVKTNLTEFEYDDIDWEGVSSGNLGNGTTYTIYVWHDTDDDDNILLYGDEDGDYMWEINTTVGKPIEIVLSEATGPRGGLAAIEGVLMPIQGFEIPGTPLWAHSNIGINGSASTIIGDVPGACPAVPDVKYEIGGGSIEVPGTSGGDGFITEPSGGMYPLPLIRSTLYNQADHIFDTLTNSTFDGITMTEDDPKLIVVKDGNANLSGNLNGYGILFIDGETTDVFEISGSVNWTGLIIVSGGVKLSGGGAGKMIRGSLVAMGDITTINGSVDIQYDCDYLNMLHDKFSGYRLVSWRQI